MYSSPPFPVLAGSTHRACWSASPQCRHKAQPALTCLPHVSLPSACHWAASKNPKHIKKKISTKPTVKAASVSLLKGLSSPSLLHSSDAFGGSAECLSGQQKAPLGDCWVKPTGPLLFWATHHGTAFPAVRVWNEPLLPGLRILVAFFSGQVLTPLPPPRQTVPMNPSAPHRLSFPYPRLRV